MSIAEAARSRETEHDIAAEMATLGADARAAAQALAGSSAETRRRALRAAAAAIRDDEAAILEANAADMAAARDLGLSAALLDRLALDPGRVEGMATGVEQVAALDDPLGRLLGEWQAAQRAPHPPGFGADRRHRDHLRIAAQRDRRCRCALPHGRERGDPARRLRELPLVARHRCGAAQGAGRDRAAGRLHPARADDRPRSRRHPAHHGRRAGPDRAARRPLADRAGACGEPGCR